MKPALLDVNVLLALAWPNHQHHAVARDWFGHHARDGWATCALTQLGFVRLSSNAAYTPLAVTPRDAADLLQRLVAHRAHRYWKLLPEVDPAMFAHALGHQQIQDCYLVCVAEKNRGRLATFDRRVVVHAKSADNVHVIGQ